MYLLEPDAQARHETGIVDVIALATAKVRGAAVCALPGHADVRRELAADLVAQAQASLGRAQARADAAAGVVLAVERSEEHTSELQSLMRTSYAVFCLKKK